MRCSMQRNSRRLLVVFLVLAVPQWIFSSAGWAQPSTALSADDSEADKFAPRPPREFDRNGFYVGLAANYAFENFDVDDEEHATGLSLDSTNSWGANGRVGYRFHPNLATELNAEYYQEFEFEDRDGLDAVRAEGTTVTANGKVFFLRERLQPYILLGAGFMYMDIKPGAFQTFDSRERLEFAGRGGLGLDFYLFDDIVLNVESSYVIPTGTLEDLQLISVVFGAQYRF